MIARAYANWGRWVADCPREFCSYAFQLEPGQSTFTCRVMDRQGNVHGCGMEAPVEWPADVAEIDAELKRRPVESTRNWFPQGHPRAGASGSPHGQTVADLRAEAELHGVK